MRTPDIKEEAQEEIKANPEVLEALESVSKDIILAVNANDAKKVSEALYDAFCIMEMYPHEETKDHSKPEVHSYDAQNQIAAKESR